MPVEGHESSPQSSLTGDRFSRAHTRYVNKESLVAPDMLLCVCKCYQEIEDGETRRRAISPSVFTLSLNSRPATEANGVLIYSWTTHTCHPLYFSDRRVTPRCHMCASSRSYLDVLFTHFTACECREVIYLSAVSFFLNKLFTFHSFGRCLFQSILLFFSPTQKTIWGLCRPQSYYRHTDGKSKKIKPE